MKDQNISRRANSLNKIKNNIPTTASIKTITVKNKTISAIKTKIKVQRDNVIAERKDDEETEQIREGYLEINPDGYGFLRVKTVNLTKWTLTCPQ